MPADAREDPAIMPELFRFSYLFQAQDEQELFQVV